MSAPDVTVTMVGNLTDAPDLRFTNNGTAVASFTIAHTPRVRRGDDWVDGDPVFVPAEVWRETAEHMAESLTKGARVVVTGVMRLDQWDDRETGQHRQRLKLVATEVGASLRYAHVDVRKVQRGGAPAPVDPWTGEAATERTAPTATAPAAR